ncbi:MAG: hypothetical protein R3F17_11855 [Planctomycetota bacterium]
MSGARQIVRGLAALWLAWGAVACSDGGSESKTVYVGFQGEAALNPYLAAEMTARELGYVVETAPHLGTLPPTDWALMVHWKSIGGPEDVTRLLGWVADGGRLWIAAAPEPRFHSVVPVDERSMSADELGEALPGTLTTVMLEKSLSFQLGPRTAIRGDVPGLDESEISWPEGPTLEPDGLEPGLYQRGYGALLRVARGRGTVELFGHLAGFDNHHLDEGGRAYLLDYLLRDPAPVAGFRIVYGHRQGFLAMLWSHAGPAILLAGAAVLLWVWRGMRRFGPAREAAGWDPEQGIGRGREFRLHLEASGHWFRKRGLWTELAPALARRLGVKPTELAPPESSRSLNQLAQLVRRKYGPTPDPKESEDGKP